MTRIALWIAVIFSLAVRGHGAIVCANCHPKETARYLASPMGSSFGPPSSVAGGRVTHQRSGSSIVIEQRAGGMTHLLSEHGLQAKYSIAYQIGAGVLARTYLVQIQGRLFESPATWFRSDGWDVSPGYANAQAIDFDRPITETCLFCHAGAARFSGVDGRGPVSGALSAITCERCHGESGEHVRRPSARNILNPSKLSSRARDSVCEQCHLEGEARVLNPGKRWSDFRPGDEFEHTAAVYMPKQESREFKPVSQVEQLAESRCAIESRGALWCGSCHRVHSDPATRQAEMRAVCVSCHAAPSKASHPDLSANCTTCHMPRVSTGYTHVAVTDHRILRRPDQAKLEGDHALQETLVAWVESPTEFRQRNLALANLTAGIKPGGSLAKRTGLDLLRGLSPSQRDRDPALLAAACDAVLTVELCRQAFGQQPESADRAMNLGITLVKAGDLAGAEQSLNRAIRLDPSLKHAYVELWSLYDRQSRIRELNETSDRFLKWNPQNIMFRVLKATISAESGTSGAPK